MPRRHEPAPHQKRIASLRASGASIAEIADITGRTFGSVNREIYDIRRFWPELLTTADDEPTRAGASTSESEWPKKEENSSPDAPSVEG